MTLIVTVNGPETIWALADRRLSDAGSVLRDDARKLMFLETTDGVAILGYAGLGETLVGKTEPADWMAAVLRGRNWPLEPSLDALAEAMKRQLPAHLLQLRGPPAHSVFIPAFVGPEARLYAIGLAVGPDGKPTFFVHTRYVNDRPVPRPPRFAITGSGARHLLKDRRWTRPLLRLVRANDRQAVAPQAVADHLAKLNHRVSEAESTVGPRCIVAWRHRKEGIFKGGGAHQCYTGTVRDKDGTMLPTIACGMDVAALVSVSMPHMMKVLAACRAGKPAPEIDKDAMNAELARLPEGPDERLR